tara:strand:- start:1994 stop:2356 length:363 start_codon:yes stop_codon:yes gene_type:complete
MPRKRIDSKYYQTILMINRWLYFYEDLTATECKKMLEDIDVKEIPPFQIPSTPRIHQIIKGLKEVPEATRSIRNEKTEARRRRKYLLNLLATEEFYFEEDFDKDDIRFKKYLDKNKVWRK